MSLHVVIMGVSGSGKTTLARLMAAQLGVTYIDGDDLHGSRNIEKMRAGTPLTDADRWPWFDRIAMEANSLPGGTVIACSALKSIYRDRLRKGLGEAAFVYLRGTRDLFQRRMSRRPGHHMPVGLLDSQLETLEEPVGEPMTIILDANDSPERWMERLLADRMLCRGVTEVSAAAR
ncbi:gluconokinase [Cucumibacter marinus]|uniref:gluconokinase n=1 Tax=Cucumibacter marinus TaxID=1121252 RepID=UPI00040D31E4|nr:gluconokinase [Cucumibacter marinus]